MRELQAARATPLIRSAAAIPPATGRSVPADARPRRTGVLLAVAACAWAVDQLTKALAVGSLAGREPIELLGGVLTLRLVRNPGAAFGLAGGMTLLFTAVAAGVVIAVLRTARRLASTAWALALGLLLGGALGNLSDRVFRAPALLRGHVVDFLELPHWPVFNVADTCIVVAAALMVLLSVRGIPLDAPAGSSGSGPAGSRQHP